MPQVLTVALFGEAEKGLLHQGVLCQNLNELNDVFGSPPPQVRGFSLQFKLYFINSS